MILAALVAIATWWPVAAPLIIAAACWNVAALIIVAWLSCVAGLWWPVTLVVVVTAWWSVVVVVVVVRRSVALVVIAVAGRPVALVVVVSWLLVSLVLAWRALLLPIKKARQKPVTIFVKKKKFVSAPGGRSVACCPT